MKYREWVIDLPCGCRLTRPDKRYRWTLIEVGRYCYQEDPGHREGDTFPSNRGKLIIVTPYGSELR